MSQTPDKRRRTDLDLFVLALVDSGVATPYEFQKTARISQGASVPALQRLFAAGFIRQGKPGPRGRTDYRATAAGRKALKIDWRGLIDSGPSGDLDADLRVALLAWWVGGDRRLATEFLSQSANKENRVPELHRTEGRLQGTSSSGLLVQFIAINSCKDPDGGRICCGSDPGGVASPETFRQQ